MGRVDILRSLTSLDLSNQLISGAIGILPASLTSLAMANNSFPGSMPTLPSSLQYLDLSGNKYTGPLPKLPSTLQTLIVNNNNVNGTLFPLPAGIQVVRVQNTLIKDVLPSVWPSQLTELNSGSSLSGFINNTLPSGLNILSIVNANLSGLASFIPSILQYLYVTGNSLN
jgi:hypothetical protein